MKKLIALSALFTLTTLPALSHAEELPEGKSWHDEGREVLLKDSVLLRNQGSCQYHLRRGLTSTPRRLTPLFSEIRLRKSGKPCVFIALPDLEKESVVYPICVPLPLFVASDETGEIRSKKGMGSLYTEEWNVEKSGSKISLEYLQTGSGSRYDYNLLKCEF